MKLPLALIALLATTSATPLLITLTENEGKFEIVLPKEFQREADVPKIHVGHLAGAGVQNLEVEEHRSSLGGIDLAGGAEQHKPCHGAAGEAGPGPLGALMSRLGYASSRAIAPSPELEPKGAHHRPSKHDKGSFVDYLVDHFTTPFIQGGVSVSFHDAGADRAGGEGTARRPVGKGRWHVKEGKEEWRDVGEGEGMPRLGHAQHGKHGKHGHGSHRHHGDFQARLHRALKNLTTYEAIALAVIVGFGFGALINLVVVMSFLVLRRFGLGPLCRRSREERQKRRQDRREARKAKKAGRMVKKMRNGNGAIRLEGDEYTTVEALPAYQQAEEVALMDEKVEVDA